MKANLNDFEIKNFKKTEEGRTYLDYNEKVGGEPIGLIIPFGYPEGVEEIGGAIKVYKKCIEKGITWEELLGYKMPEDIEI